MIKVLVYDVKNDIKIGAYETTIVPRAGEILGANNGNWTIVSIQHALRGSLDITAPAVFQTEVIIYVRKLT